MIPRRPGSAPPCRRCPHPRGTHAPYLPAGDRPGFCASCACWQYQPERPWTQLLAWLRRSPAPVRADVLRPHPVPYPVPGRGGDDDKTEFGLRVAPYLKVPRRRGEPW